MSIAVIRATINWDGCGKQFKVETDPAEVTRDGISLSDLADAAVSSGASAEGMGMCSMQEGKHLCPECTAFEDAKDYLDDEE